MSEFTAVGPALDLDGPPPVAPRHPLLATEGVVVTEDATRVLNGVNVYGYPTGCSSLWEPCSDGTFRTKDSESEQPDTSLRLVRGLQAHHLLIDWDGRPGDVLRTSLEGAGCHSLCRGGVHARGRARGIVQSRSSGTRTWTILNSGTAVSPSNGFAFLEEAIGETCRQGMIHATPAVIASGTQTFPLSGMDRLETANGTPVVSGMGYQGVDTPWLATPGATRTGSSRRGRWRFTWGRS